MPEQITVTISPNGEAEIKVNGVAGPRCKQVTSGIEKAMGRVTKTTPTADMQQTVANNNHLRR